LFEGGSGKRPESLEASANQGFVARLGGYQWLADSPIHSFREAKPGQAVRVVQSGYKWGETMSRVQLFIAKNAMAARLLGVAFAFALAHFGVHAHADPLLP
jgi:hypothetical protein